MRALLALLLMVVALGVASAQERTDAPASIPLPEVASRAERVMADLRQLDALLVRLPEVEAIERELPQVVVRVRERSEETTLGLAAAPSLTVLDVLVDGWEGVRQALLEWVDVLTRRATRLEEERQRVDGVVDRWRRARDDAREGKAPAAVTERVDSVLAALDGARWRLEAERDAILALQGRVAALLAQAEDALAALERWRRTAVGDLLVRDSPPIWSPELRARALARVPVRVRDVVGADAAELADFLASRPWRLAVQLAGLVALGLALRRGQARARRWMAQEESVVSVAAVFDHPFASALLLAALASWWIYPGHPRLMGVVVPLLVVPPVLVISRHIVPAPVRPALYALGSFYVADRLRDFAAVVPLLERTLFLLEVAAGVIVAGWLLASGRLARAPGQDAPRASTLRSTTIFALVVLAVALTAGTLGYVRLAQVGASALFRVGYRTLVIYAGVRVTLGLVAYVLRVRPLRLLYAVQRHRPLIERRVRGVLTVIGTAAWLAGALDAVELLDPALVLGRASLQADLAPGPLVVTLGNLLLFGATVWAAFLSSSFLRFILGEDVYPRLPLARGLPYAASAILHYATLFVGFLFGVTILGVDLTRVTILAGALGVGVGFGLQGIVNNFVSGLILLTERPLKIGDSIQFGDLAGQVTRIGMRSSTVRTWEGAEVIVPNATLVGERVINWTLSDRMRRIDLPVGVAYATPPEQVLELLTRVARAHAGVVAEPAPQALFLGFGDSALKFELRAWTAHFEDWLRIRSELGVAVYAALSEAKIEIPFPQQDVRIRRDDPGGR